jgi:hypothetical protein
MPVLTASSSYLPNSKSHASDASRNIFAAPIALMAAKVLKLAKNAEKQEKNA